MIEVQIIGAGGLGREIGAAIENDPRYSLLGYFDDNAQNIPHSSVKIIGKTNDIQAKPVIIGIATPSIKKNILDIISNNKCEFINYKHPLSGIELEDSVHIGKGSILCAGSRLTRDISIGAFVLVNLNVTIGHDVIIGDFSSIMPGVHISGAAVIEEGVLIGSGAVVLQGIKVGKNAIVGAGAVVTRDVPTGAKVVGVPARTIT